LQESSLRIPVTPLTGGPTIAGAEDDSPKSFLAKLTSKFDMRGPSVRALQAGKEASGPRDHGTLAHCYMADQLSQYSPSDADSIYDTVRLETRRTPSSSGSVDEAHLYEMYWSDLSHPGSGVLQGIGEFYQLLFELCGLGRHAIDAALATHPASKSWKWLKW